MGRSSIFPSIMAVISNLDITFLKSFEANVTGSCSIEFSPLFMSKGFHRIFRKHMIKSSGFVRGVIAKHFCTILTSIELY